ncbi:response regulator [Lactovum odontotermitis]
MKNKDFIKFTESAKDFSHTPLGIIALLIVLVYGLATLVIIFGSSLSSSEKLPFIWFLVIFPFFVLIVFAFLIARHHQNLYAPSDYKNETDFLTVAMNSAVNLAVANSSKDNDFFATKIDGTTETVLGASYGIRNNLYQKKNRILWVDDNPQNNFYECKAFEALGLKVSPVLSTQEAFEKLEGGSFDIIISDMGRKEGEDEGYKLLKKLREENNDIPFFIYSANGTRNKYRLEAKEKGAQGSTDNPNELFQMVTKQFQNI